LIQRLIHENPLWGTPRIQYELALLGYIVAESTVDQYRIHPRKPSSQMWRAFLDHHVRDIVAIDFFTVPTATFRIVFAFVVLLHDGVPIAMALRCPVSFTSPLGQIQNSSRTIENHEVLGKDVYAEYAIDLGEQPFAPCRVRSR